MPRAKSSGRTLGSNRSISNLYIKKWGVVSYWPLTEQNGTRLDMVGTNHLQDNNGVTQATGGPLGNAGSFASASSQYLSCSSNSSLQTGNVDFWIACWFSWDGTNNYPAIASKVATNPAKEEWLLSVDHTTNKVGFTVSPDGTQPSEIGVTASTFGILSINTWYFVIAYHDMVNNLLKIAVNGGVFDSTAMTGGFSGDESFRIGARKSNTVTGYFGSKIQGVVFGKSPPGGISNVISEINTRLYNGSAGRQFPW
jgi:hypothetical protein